MYFCDLQGNFLVWNSSSSCDYAVVKICTYTWKETIPVCFLMHLFKLLKFAFIHFFPSLSYLIPSSLYREKMLLCNLYSFHPWASEWLLWKYQDVHCWDHLETNKQFIEIRILFLNYKHGWSEQAIPCWMNFIALWRSCMLESLCCTHVMYKLNNITVPEHSNLKDCFHFSF